MNTAPAFGRDSVSIHFWPRSDPRTPKETGCRICVEGIDALFEDFSRLGIIHPNGRPESKPWGTREFSILDVDGNLVTFSEAAVQRACEARDVISSFWTALCAIDR